MRRAFTLVELMFVALVIGGLMVVVFRIYKTNADYEAARQVDEFVKAVDKGLFTVNAILQSSSLRKPEASPIEGDNGGLYLMVSDTSFGSVYSALMNGDCMVRCFDGDDSNNSWCGGNAADFNGMCDNNKQRLCLVGILEQKYLNTYMIPKVLQGRVSFVATVLKNPYEVVVDSKTGQKITAGRLVKLWMININLSNAPGVAQILQNMDRRYDFGFFPFNTNILSYPLNNGAGHLVIVRNGYVCQ
jgi:type II secretory pathway pseudopilin PulG